jgi:hypothetical protein
MAEAHRGVESMSLATIVVHGRRLYAGWSPVQRGFLWLGLLQLASAGVHAVIALSTGTSLDGPVSIRKPVLFAEAFGLVSLSLAPIFHDLGLPRRLVAPLGWTSIALSAMEVVLATVQYWRGVPSHFNYATPLDAAIAGTMVAGAAAFALFLPVVTVLAWRAPLERTALERRSIVHGVRLALPLALVGLGAIGTVMLLNGGQAWHGWSFFTTAIRDFEIGRYNGHAADLQGGGRLMTSHAMATHALQVLPLAGWWFGRNGAPEVNWRPRLTLLALGYGAAILAAAALAFQAR